MKTLLAIFAALLLVGSCAAQPAPITPADVIRMCAADCARLPPDVRLRVRYLSLYHVRDAKDRQRWHAVISFWANSLSRERIIVPVPEVAPGLYRIDLSDYQWDTKVWERLLDTEPYWHVRTVAVDVKVVPIVVPADDRFKADGSARKIDTDDADIYFWSGGRDREGTYFAAGFFARSTGRSCAPPKARSPPAKKDDDKKQQQFGSAYGPWIPAADAAALTAMTGSQVPVVRADWWLYQTAIAKDRKAGYYDWLGLGEKEKDFQDLIGADIKRADLLRLRQGGVIGRSAVTLHNRRILRVPVLTGAYWFTDDYDRNTDVKHALRLIDGETPPDASRQYGSLPNELFAFWLQNGKGERQDTAPDFIAGDRTVATSDTRVHVGANCVMCHVEGLRPVDDLMRKLYAVPYTLDSPDPVVRKRLQTVYLTDLNESLENDRQRYAKALKKVNGLTAAQNAAAFKAAWDYYYAADWTPDDVAWQVGVTPAALRARLKAKAERGYAQLDPVLQAIHREVPVRAEWVEEVYALLQVTMAEK